LGLEGGKGTDNFGLMSPVRWLFGEVGNKALRLVAMDYFMYK
jgi:hypothetical protein